MYPHVVVISAAGTRVEKPRRPRLSSEPSARPMFTLAHDLSADTFRACYYRRRRLVVIMIIIIIIKRPDHNKSMPPPPPQPLDNNYCYYYRYYCCVFQPSSLRPPLLPPPRRPAEVFERHVPVPIPNRGRGRCTGRRPRTYNFSIVVHETCNVDVCAHAAPG